MTPVISGFDLSNPYNQAQLSIEVLYNITDFFFFASPVDSKAYLRGKPIQTKRMLNNSINLFNYTDLKAD